MKNTIIGKLLIGYFLVGLMLTGCSSQNNGTQNKDETQIKLDTPQRINYDSDSNTLEWSIVDNASSYYVLIDDAKERNSSVNYYDLNNLTLAVGSHFAQIKAVGQGKYLSSDYSARMSFTIVKNNEQQSDSADDSSEINNFGKSMKLNAYNGIPKETFDLSNSINIDDKYYIWYFDLGWVYRTPVYKSDIHQYHFDYDVSFKFSALHSYELQDSISESHEVVDTHSYTGGFEIKLAQEFEFGTVPFLVSNKSTISFEENTDHHWTNNWGSTTIKSNYITHSYLDTYSEETSIHINFNEESGFTRDYYYRIAFYEAIHNYGVLIYDNVKKVYSYGFSEFFEPDYKLCLIEESETGMFSYTKDKSLVFDLDKAVEIAEDNIPENLTIIKEEIHYYPGYQNVYYSTPSNRLTFDFSSYELIKSISDFKFDYFKDGVLTINPMLDSWNIYEVEIISLYGCENPKDGSLFGDEYIFDQFSIVFSNLWDRTPILKFKNFASYITPNHYLATTQNDLVLKFEGNIKFIEKDSDIGTVRFVNCNNLDIIGVNTNVATINYSLLHDSNSCGADVIECNNFSILNAELNVVGGNAISSNYNSIGGSAIKCNQFTASKSNVTLVGGNGGDGFDGGIGENGTNGGDGGVPLVANEISITNSQIDLIGGNGGNGGRGGKGLNGSTNNETTFDKHVYGIFGAEIQSISHYNKAFKGEKGGTGGKGGNGGLPVIFNTFSCVESAVTLRYGDGGFGGDGGEGGDGGAGHNYSGIAGGFSYLTCNDPGQGGDAGDGGDGGDAGRSVVKTIDILLDGVKIIAGENGTPGKGGAAGSVGIGGAGGSTHSLANNHSADKAKDGNPGQKGKDGN